jgi:hypothetical protein
MNRPRCARRYCSVVATRGERQPIERDGDLFRRKERPVAFADAVDLQILDEHLTAKEMNLERADVQRPLDVLRAGRLGLRANGRPEIDRDRDDDCGRKQGNDQREAEADVSKRPMLADALKEFH